MRPNTCSVISLLLCGTIVSSAAVTPEAMRTPAPKFTLTDAKGHPVSLSAYQGRVLLLDFWATWCGGCKTEIPWYVDFYRKYHRHGLAVIGVAMDDGGMKVVAPFAKEKRINYKLVAGSDAVAKQYHVEAMPVTLLIDRNGRIAESHSGVVDRREFEQDIRQLLR